MSANFLFSSESVTEGHPDKVADTISDHVLDAFLAQDPEAKVACETLVTTNTVILAGEVNAQLKTPIDYDRMVRAAIKEIGYTNNRDGFDSDSVKITNLIHEQSRDINQGLVVTGQLGAGDQGMMFGFACRETDTLMPMPIWLSHRIAEGLTKARKSGRAPWLRPDGKVQVTVEYKNGKPVALHTLVLSTQHSEDVAQSTIDSFVREDLLPSLLPTGLLSTQNTKYYVNPSGRFVIGGPHGDCGLTGRKIIVDTYGGYAPHGGGAFSGKDASKVDRSAAYMARYIAKNVVAAGLADSFMIQLAYAIGRPDPVSLHFEDYGTLKVSPARLDAAIREAFSLTPGGIIESLGLKKPIFSKTTNYGHFGREVASFGWEKTDKVEMLKKLLA
jgi:S-adenosylmethionine synthetase